MIKYIKEEISHTVTEKVTVENVYYCDVCKKVFARSYTKDHQAVNHLNVKMKPVTYFEVHTFHHEWGNDSCESYETFEICSSECLKKKLDEYLEIIKKYGSQEFQIEPEYTETIVEEGEK